MFVYFIQEIAASEILLYFYPECLRSYNIKIIRQIIFWEFYFSIIHNGGLHYDCLKYILMHQTNLLHLIDWEKSWKIPKLHFVRKVLHISSILFITLSLHGSCKKKSSYNNIIIEFKSANDENYLVQEHAYLSLSLPNISIFTSCSHFEENKNA